MAKPIIRKKIVGIKIDKSGMNRKRREDAQVVLEDILYVFLLSNKAISLLRAVYPGKIVVTREVHSITKEITHE